jgi:diguanylate cyclase (GGDEF)-like protein
VNELLKIIVCFLFLSSIGIANSLHAKNLRFHSLTTADGLPSISVFQTYQQRNGFIWFATDRGASRYDGKSYRHFFYSPGTSNHITNNFVIQIFEDNLGNIWILTEDGLNKIRLDGGIEYFQHDDSKPDSINSNWLHFIYQDSSNRIWIGTNEGLNLYHAPTNTFTQMVGRSKNTANTIAAFHMVEIGTDNFLLGTLQGISFFKPSEQAFILESDKDNDVPRWYQDDISSMTLSKTGRVLIGTQTEGLIDFNPASYEFTQYKVALDEDSIASNAVETIIERPNGDILLGHYEKGLMLISSNRQTFSLLTAREFDETSLISNTINHLFEDQSGLLWISTDYGISTLSYLQSGSNLIQKQANGMGLSGMIVFDTALMDKEHMLIATSSGLNKLRFSDQTIEQIELLPEAQKDQPSVAIRDLNRDLKGIFWLASADGLHQYNPKNDKVINYLNTKNNAWGLTETELTTVLADNNNNVWITGYLQPGLAKFIPEKGIVNRFLDDELHPYTKGGNYTNDTLISKNGDLWLATTDGIYRINPQSGFEQHIRMGKDNRENIRTTSIIEDTNGTIWATTAGVGIVRLRINEDNNVETTYFSTDEGLPSNELFTVSIYRDKLWLTTKDQLFSYDTNNKKSTVYPSLLNFPGLNFEGSSQTLVGDNLYLGSNKGLVVVTLNQIKSNQYNAPIQITQVKSDEKIRMQRSDNQSKNYISYKNNNLSFSYAALDFTQPSANRYRYLLQGFDENWVEAGNKTDVTYNNLSAGTYTFKVTASNSDGIWSDQVSVFTFEIEQAWWFYTLWSLAGLLALALLLFIINRRLHVRTLYQKANYDSLTSLANRYYFNNRIEQLVDNPDSAFTLLIVDLDGFKEVNDIYGHAVGDELLIQASARMRKVLRDDDLLARLGGDEFAIIINKRSQSSELLTISERLRKTLETHYTLTNHTVKASASIGGASFPCDTNNKNSLLVYADTAMFAAKQSGKNSVNFFNESLSKELEKRTQLKQKLQSALDNKEFEVYYQPQINQFSNQITGFEALIRWFQPDGTTITPDVFIPEAERNGSIIQIGGWVLSSACKQAAIWHEAGLFSGNISVNVSADQITRPDFVNDVEQALKQSGLSPNYLELEITESVLVDNIGLTLDTLTQLRILGVTIALDDFGTGYSSLNYLTTFPIDTLKIDKSFIHSVEIDAPTRIVLKNIYTLAADLSMKVIAEGVETEAQLQILATLQGQIIQGFYYSEALSAKDATKLLCDNDRCAI